MRNCAQCGHVYQASAVDASTNRDARLERLEAAVEAVAKAVESLADSVDEWQGEQSVYGDMAAAVRAMREGK